jgi:hypothetical protein
MKNKAGNPMPKQAHMELALKAGIDVTLGDVLYYINTGNSKTQGDLKTINRSKLTKKQMEKYIAEHGGPPTSEITVQLNCKLIDPEIVDRDFELIKEVEMLNKALAQLEDDPESQESLQARIDEINSLLFTDEYNVGKYLESFNKKVKPLLVCFSPDIRDRILLNIVKDKDKTTKVVTEKLQERLIFTKGECGLISGIPFKEADQDSYEELMTMEDKEIKFWDKVNKLPNYMSVEEWEAIRKDYHNRLVIAKAEGIQHEKNTLEDIFKKLEVADLNKVITKGVLPIEVFAICDLLGDGSGNLASRKWGEVLCHVDDIFKYEKEAVERNKFYKLIGCENEEQRYELWLEYIIEQRFLTGETESIVIDEIESKKDNVVDKIAEYALEIKSVVQSNESNKKSKDSEDDEDDSDDEDDDSETGRDDEELKLDDEFDDTFGDVPDDYVFEQPKEENVVDDEWPF